MIKRMKKKKVKVGTLAIGGNAPIVLQSMTTVKTSRIAAVVKQINQLASCGCDLVRVSILNSKDAEAIAKIKPQITIPLCADIHFNYEYALAAIAAGADKIRINPGNIGDKKKVRAVIQAAKKRNVAVRVGVNSGSLEKQIYSMNKRARAMVQSLKRVVAVCEGEGEGFTNLVLSIKSSDPLETIEANRLLAQETQYPIHLGVTATGAGMAAVIKSTAALSVLLAEGIGDTIRVSLTDDPTKEVFAGEKILQALKLRACPYEVIACPTCGRTEIPLQKIVTQVEKRIKEEFYVKGKPEKGKSLLKYQSIAVMGCVVNGPGEAQDADIAIAGGRGFGFIFKKGKQIRKVTSAKLVDALIKELKA